MYVHDSSVLNILKKKCLNRNVKNVFSCLTSFVQLFLTHVPSPTLHH